MARENEFDRDPERERSLLEERVLFGVCSVGVLAAVVPENVIALCGVVAECTSLL